MEMDRNSQRGPGTFQHVCPGQHLEFRIQTGLKAAVEINMNKALENMMIKFLVL